MWKRRGIRARTVKHSKAIKSWCFFAQGRNLDLVESAGVSGWTASPPSAAFDDMQLTGLDHSHRAAPRPKLHGVSGSFDLALLVAQIQGRENRFLIVLTEIGIGPSFFI